MPVHPHPNRIADSCCGKTRLLGPFVGQLMQATKGKANPQVVNEVLEKHLDGVG